MSAPTRTNKFLLGGILTLALLIGGGTTRGLYTDQIIVCLCVIAFAVSFTSPNGERVGKWPIAFAAAIILGVSLQLVPLPASMLAAWRPQFLDEPVGIDPGFTTISLGVGQTVESLTLVLAPVAFFLCVLRLPSVQAKGLLPFFFVGVAANLVVSVVQYSLITTDGMQGIMPFRMAAGLFANANHFSTLLFVTIPILVYLVFRSARPILGLIALICILLMLLAVGSRAGALIGLAITVLSFVVLPARTRPTVGIVIALFVGIAIYTAGTWSKIDVRNVDPDFGRLEFARTTIAGIWQNWPFGIGYGNFVRGYSIYENPEMIFSEYVNHAHNDYLELVFEGGVFAAILICIYLLFLGKRIFSKSNRGLQRAALISIVFILVHSIVDYPLRTMAISITFAFLNGLAFHPGLRRTGRHGSSLIEVEHNGDKFLVAAVEPGRIPS